MLTFGFILLGIAVILAILGFGMVSSPVVGTARIAFYFILVLSLAFMAIPGIVSEDSRMLKAFAYVMGIAHVIFFGIAAIAHNIQKGAKFLLLYGLPEPKTTG